MISFTGSGHSATYVYNGDGLRQSKTVDSVTTSDVWMAVGQGLPVIVADKIGSTTAYYVTGAAGAPLEQMTATTPYYYHSNMLRSTRKLTDGAGAVQQSYDYDPYGNPLSLTLSIPNPFQFVGEYADAETGLYYLRARYYDPATAQFTTRDALVEATRRPYQYVENDPLNFTDPTGLGCCNWWLFALGVLEGLDAFSTIALGTAFVTMGLGGDVATAGAGTPVAGVFVASGLVIATAGGGALSYSSYDAFDKSGCFDWAKQPIGRDRKPPVFV